MAERRMFTKKVTDDDNFMSLSASAQALYLHLSMSSDDDGFCNQISVCMFKAHASTQDLQALLEKRYIYQFENGVIVIKHWRMANALRKDRYTPTAFKEELAKLQLKDNGSYTMITQDKNTWLPDGCQVVATCLPQDSIGKNSIDKNIYTSSLHTVEDIKEDADDAVLQILKCWGDTYSPLSQLSPTRFEALLMLLKVFTAEDVKKAIKMSKESKFLQSKTWFTFEWFIKQDNLAKILDGNYKDKCKTTTKSGTNYDDLARELME